MILPETERLVIREFAIADAGFILELLNTPGWLQFIGDRKVRTIADAEGYITNVPMASYAKNGFGLYGVELKDTGSLIGMCGLIRREGLPDIDLGFAVLPAWSGKGYAYEAALAVMNHAIETLKPERLLAITSLDNKSSIVLLERLGFVFKEIMPFGDEELRLFEKAVK